MTEGFPPEVTRRLKDLLHGESLVPTVTITFLRHAMDLAAGKSRVELSLDEGIIESGDRSQSLREVEFELKEGDPAALFELVSHLAGEIPSIRKTGVKLERGLFLLAGKTPQESCDDAVKVPKTFADAARFLREILHDLGGFFNGTGKKAPIADRLILLPIFGKKRPWAGTRRRAFGKRQPILKRMTLPIWKKILKRDGLPRCFGSAFAKVYTKSHEEESYFCGNFHGQK